MNAGIYIIVVRRPARPDLFYVGQASNLERRRRDHFRHLRGGRHDNRRLQALFDKHGPEVFSFETVLVCDLAMLASYEQATLNFYLTSVKRRVLNICRECVTSTAGCKMSAATRAKQSAAKKGKPGRIWTAESRAKLSATNAGKKPSAASIQATVDLRTGKPLSLATRQKMSASHVGRKFTDEHKANIKSSRVGAYTPEVRAAISSAMMGNKNNLGKRHSLETRKKLSAAAIAREDRKRSGANKEIVS